MIKLFITVIGIIALWRLWGTPYKILWWSILVLLVLDWLTAETVRRATRDKSEWDVIRFWVWTNMGISIVCLILSIVGIVLPYFAARPLTGELTGQIPSSVQSRTIRSDDRRFCRKAIMSFIKAHGMQLDKDGNILQLTVKQEEEMKGLIRIGIESAKKVSDSFLDQVHPELKHQFTDHLVNGWTLYLEGLNRQSVTDQLSAIQLVQRWEAFREANIDLLYERIIK